MSTLITAMARGVLPTPTRPPRIVLAPSWRILLVDADSTRRAQFRQWLEIAGAAEPETAQSGDEALDILGAAAQQFDVVAAWLPLPDGEAVDFVGILRRCRSPVRLLVVTALTPAEFPKPGRLAGAGAIDASGTPRGFVDSVRRLMVSDQTVAEIVAAGRAPGGLPRAWTLVIYGAPPGGRFTADLD